MLLSHWRTPNDVMRVMVETLITTDFAAEMLPKPAKCSSTSPFTVTSATSPCICTSTPAFGRLLGGFVTLESRAMSLLGYLDFESMNTTDLLTSDGGPGSSPARRQKLRFAPSLKNRWNAYGLGAEG